MFFGVGDLGGIKVWCLNVGLTVIGPATALGKKACVRRAKGGVPF